MGNSSTQLLFGNLRRSQHQNLAEPIECMFCQSKAVTLWQTKVAESAAYPIWRCLVCRSGFVWPRPTEDEIRLHYEGAGYGPLTREESDRIDSAYYPASWGDAYSIIARCAEIVHGKHFLDVGAGSGTFSHVANMHGFSVDAIEPSQNARTIFYERNRFLPHGGFFDLAFAEERQDAYDVVLLSQVLEHLTQPLEVVRNIRRVLHKGGLAVIAVPYFGSLLSWLQGANDMFVTPPEHLNFFSRRGLRALFLRGGFHLRFVETVSKVPRRRIQQLARFRLLGAIGWRALYAAMLFSNWVNLGMVLIMYFEKRE
jgi:SAM-dependent methyltransferase